MDGRFKSGRSSDTYVARGAGLYKYGKRSTGGANQRQEIF